MHLSFVITRIQVSDVEYSGMEREELLADLRQKNHSRRCINEQPAMSMESERRLSKLVALDAAEEDPLARLFESQFPTTKSRRRRGSDSEVVVSRNEAANHRFDIHTALDSLTNHSPIHAVTPETPERPEGQLEKGAEDTTPDMPRRKIVSETEIRR